MSSPARAVIIGPAFPLRGGIADFNEALSLALSGAGIQNIIFSFYYQYPGILFPGSSQQRKGVADPGLEIRSTLSSINPVSWHRTVKEIISYRPDFVIVRYWIPFMAPSLGTVCRKIRKSGIPVIAITDNIIPHERRPGDSVLTGYFCGGVNAFVAMSRKVMEETARFAPGAIRAFLPHPVYSIFGPSIGKAEARARLGLESDKRILLFFGFIRAYKGLDLLLEAMAEKRLENLDICLVVAGEFYENREKYLKIISDNNLDTKILLRSDYIPQDEVAAYFCAADMVVQPYKHATQSGITQIAYHFGRPMLVTDVGGLGEIVPEGKAGYVTSPDAASIATAIEDFYRNNREEEFSSYVLSEKGKFSWETFVNGILSLYEKIIA